MEILSEHRKGEITIFTNNEIPEIHLTTRREEAKAAVNDDLKHLYTVAENIEAVREVSQRTDILDEVMESLPTIKKVVPVAESALNAKTEAVAAKEEAVASKETANAAAITAVESARSSENAAQNALASETASKNSEKISLNNAQSAEENANIASEKASLAYDSATSALSHAENAEKAQLLAESAADRAEEAVDKLQRVMLYKGSVSTFADLPVINELGDVWNVSDTGANYAWDGEKWDKFSEIVDLKDYVKNTDFANVNTGGVIRSSSYYGTSMQNDGKMCGVNLSLDNYTTADKLAFISKGTLENAKNDIVKRGIVDNDIILTDTEKQKAKDWLGISGGGGSGGGSVVIETEITEDSTDATVPSSKAVWDKVNVLEDRFVEGNTDFVIEGTGLLAKVGSREFYKKNDGLAYGMVYRINGYNGCILVSEIAEAVVINPPSDSAEGSFEYDGRTWYYSSDRYFMGSYDITLGLMKVNTVDTPFDTQLEAARYVIENGINYKVNGLVTDVTNVKEEVSKLANAYTSSNLKAGTNIALTKAGYHKILSNFSSSRYVKFIKNFNPTNSYRMIVGLTTGSDVKTTQSILSVQGVDRNFYLKGSGSVFSYYPGSSVAGKTVATAKTDYWLVFDYDGTTCKLYLAKDDGTYVNPKDLPALTDSFWTEELSYTTEIFKGKDLQLGKNGSTTAYWFGSINLGKVLITADGDEWFNGLTAEEGIDYTNLGCTVVNERVEGLEVATTIDCLITKTSQLENDSGFLTSAEGAGGNGKNIGEVYYSQSSLATDNAGALPLFTGETIASANTIYPDFYAWVEKHTELQTTAEEYESALTTYGECPKYVISNGSLRLPKLTNYVKMANTTDGITQAEAGLPNITGSVGGVSAAGDTDGAFEAEEGGVNGNYANGNNWVVSKLNASRSSEVYGKSDTVTPAHTTLYPWVYAFSKAVEASTAQAAEFQNGLSGKADTNLGNVTEEGKENAVAWGRNFVNVNKTVVEGSNVGTIGTYELGFTDGKVKIGVFNLGFNTTSPGHSNMGITTDVVSNIVYVGGTNNGFATTNTVTIPFINSVTLTSTNTTGGISNNSLVLVGYFE